MSNQEVRGFRYWLTHPRWVIALAALVVLIIGGGIVAIRQSNDFNCSDAEQQAMSEFPQHSGAVLDWETNAMITGGCTTSYTVDATADDVRNYYQEQLVQRGWTVQMGPANSFPIHLQAERDGLHFDLNFNSPAGLERYGEDNAETRERMRVAQEREMASCPECPKPGQTRVSISGGQR